MNTRHQINAALKEQILNNFDIPVCIVGEPDEPIPPRQLKRRIYEYQKKLFASLPSIIIRPKRSKSRTIKHVKLMEVSFTPRGMEIGFIEESPKR